jgi:hypothetical protein
MSKMRNVAKESTLKALGQIEGRNTSQELKPSAEVATAFVSFSIHKKVGDAEIHASGPMGSEAKAREMVDEAAQRLRSSKSS